MRMGMARAVRTPVAMLPAPGTLQGVHSQGTPSVRRPIRRLLQLSVLRLHNELANLQQQNLDAICVLPIFQTWYFVLKAIALVILRALGRRIGLAAGTR